MKNQLKIFILLFSFWLLFDLTELSLDHKNNNGYFGKYVGSFNHDWNHNHDNIITGNVYFVNKQTLFINNFSFDGQQS
ncbi:hypothetical protein BLA29_013945, partial [Euroglyphus maynei]